MIWKHIHICIHIYLCAQNIHIHVVYWDSIHQSINLSKWTHTHTRAHTRILSLIHTQTSIIHLSIYISTHTHARAHTHTHTHTRTNLLHRFRQHTPVIGRRRRLFRRVCSNSRGVGEWAIQEVTRIQVATQFCEVHSHAFLRASRTVLTSGEKWEWCSVVQCGAVWCSVV